MLFLLFACEESSIQEESGFPVIMDTNNAKLEKLRYPDLNRIDYNVLYIGEERDTITVDHFINFYSFPDSFMWNDSIRKVLNKWKESDYYLDWLDERKYHSWLETNLSITVDTTQIISKINGDVDWPMIQAYPVLIKNTSPDTLIVGYGDTIPLSIEARDSSGVWRAIERPFVYHCGTGLGNILLPQNEITISSMYVYDGDFETQLRLKLGESFSNMIDGRVYYSQLKLDDMQIHR